MTKYLGKEMDENLWEYVIQLIISRFYGKFDEQPSTFQVMFSLFSKVFH